MPASTPVLGGFSELDDRQRSALLWGVVAGLAFAVLAQGYNAFGPGGITAGALVGVAVVVAAVGAAVAYVAEGVLAG